MHIYLSLKTKLSFFLLLITINFSSQTLYAEESIFFSVNAETEIEISVSPAKGDTLFLWLYSEAGPQKTEHEIIKQLVKKKY